MLPDFPETKLLFHRFFVTHMRRKARAISPLGAVKVRYIHEGHGMETVRADQSVSDGSPQQFTSMMEIKSEEIEKLTFQDVLARYDQVVLDMVRQQASYAFAKLDQEIPDSNKLDAKGKKMDAAMMLEMLKAMETDFYPDGSPHELHVVGFSQGRLDAIDQEVKSNPELQKQFDEMMQEKKEKWLAREADRKLVG
jgi:hypothetical protein